VAEVPPEPDASVPDPDDAPFAATPPPLPAPLPAAMPVCPQPVRRIAARAARVMNALRCDMENLSLSFRCYSQL
jgi:hypothetical protein